MQEQIKKILSKVTGFWKALALKHKIALIAGAAVLAAVIAVIALFSNTVRYTPLYLGLDATEAGTIVTKVQAMNVPVKLEGTGNVYVDSRKADTVKMELAEAGYPQTSLSYDIFMKGTSWAMTDSDKRKLALYQVQDRLQDTIRTIPGVDSVEVTISQQDDDSYVLTTDKAAVTASVKLNLTPGASLTAQQVNGIVLLVAKSVPNLDQKNVAVLDGNGSALAGGGEDDTSGRLELQTKVEDMIQSKLTELLAPVYGAKNVRVAAGVTLDFSSTVTNKTTYSPNSNGLGVPQTQDRTGTATGGAQSGAATQYTGSTAAVSAASGSAQNESTTYLVNTINEEIQDSGGRVNNMTIAVLLDSRSTAAAANADTVRQTVAYAAGVDAKNISVQFAPFASNSQAVTGTSSAGAQAKQLNLYLVGAAAGAVALLLTLLLITLRISHKRRKKLQLAQEINRLKATQPAPEPIPPQASDFPPQVSPPSRRSADSTKEERKELQDFADDKPDMIAQLIRDMLKD